MKKNTGLALTIGLIVSLAVLFASAAPPPGGGPGAPPNTELWTDLMVAHSAASTLVGSKVQTSDFAPYYTPLTFASILEQSYQTPALKAASAVTPLVRYLISASDSYLTMGIPSTTAPTSLSMTGLPSTLGSLLTQLFEAISEPLVPGGFRLDSELHSLYSVDVAPNGATLVAHNAWGSAAQPSARGYLVFTYDGGTKLLRARGRYAYDPSKYSRLLVANFSQKDWYVKIGSSSASLVASASEATPLTFLESPIDVSIPANFNPRSIPYVSNQRVSLTARMLQTTVSDMIGPRSKTTQDMAQAYLPQLAQPGDDAGTQAAASAMLDQILKTSKLRYPKEVYLAFRKGVLRATLASDNIANGKLGMLVAPYGFFTNAADASGTYHPFLCIATYSITQSPNRLVDVRRPPGDGSKDYPSGMVTRDATLQLDLIKIPLKDYGLVTKVTENKMMKSLKSDGRGAVTDSVYSLASVSGVGIAVDGSEIYPVLNNTLATTQQNAEITSVGNHVGQGMGLHYHADGHIALNNDVQLYNINDYPGHNHPPLIGFGYDGIALYGVYEEAYSMEGNDVALDSFGGHSHGAFGYHYHSHQVQVPAENGQSGYVLDVFMKGAWKGRINEIPEFWGERGGDPAVSMAQRSPYVGKR
jgi:hypothetical protein